jgi:hypothetical protein
MSYWIAVIAIVLSSCSSNTEHSRLNEGGMISGGEVTFKAIVKCSLKLTNKTAFILKETNYDGTIRWNDPSQRLFISDSKGTFDENSRGLFFVLERSHLRVDSWKDKSLHIQDYEDGNPIGLIKLASNGSVKIDRPSDGFHLIDVFSDCVWLARD